jgi:hypothetical protein
MRGVGDHAAIAVHDDALQFEAVFQFGDLARHGRGIGGVALEYLDRDGVAVGGAYNPMTSCGRSGRWSRL